MNSLNVRDYSVLKYINKGSYGEVFAARSKITGEIVAVKSCKKSEFIPLEITILRLLNHENILKLLEVQLNSGVIHLITEFCDILDLNVIICRHNYLRELTVQAIFQQLGLAMSCLRAHNIVHMDIKPGNILLHSIPEKKRIVVKLADFGLSQILLPGQTGSKNNGTILYTAPEVHLEKAYDASVDLWSLGVVLYESMFGLRPFSSLERIIAYSEHPWPLRIPTTNKISTICKDIMFRLLKADPQERIVYFSTSFQFEVTLHLLLNLDCCEDVDNFSSFLASVFDATDALKISFKEGSGVHLSLMGLQISSLDPNRTELEGEKKIVNEMLTAFRFDANEMKKINQMRLVFPTLQSYENILGILLLTREEFEEGLQLAKRAENLASVNMYSLALQMYEYAVNLMSRCVLREPARITRLYLQQEAEKWNMQYQSVKCMFRSC